ncbi:MAG: hypothetical protein M1830_010169, partial [Pleopsidium flavum]
MTPIDPSLGMAWLPVDNGVNRNGHMSPSATALLWQQPDGYPQLMNSLPQPLHDVDEPFFLTSSLESAPDLSPRLRPVGSPVEEFDPRDGHVEPADEGVEPADEDAASATEEANSQTSDTIIVVTGAPEISNTHRDDQNPQGPQEEIEERLPLEPAA